MHKISNHLKDTMCVITGFGRTQGTADEKVLNQQTLPVVENKQVKLCMLIEVRKKISNKICQC